MKHNIQVEVIPLTVLFALMLLIMKILFFDEGLMVLLRVVASLYWLYILPGYALMHIWSKELDFTTRIIIGTAAGFALISAASYYMGLLGIHTGYHSFVLPPVVIIAGALIGIIRFRKK
jgi:hypothetical protein